MKIDKEVYEKIKLILSKKFKVDTILIQEEAKLEDDLGLDSIELMDAIGFVELEFKIKIVKKGTVDMQFPITVCDLVSLVSQKIKETITQ